MSRRRLRRSLQQTKEITLDGITHVNIYSKGKTKLGRMLSNFYASPIITVDGNFNSVEGYWYWLSCPNDYPHKNDFRTLVGWQAKERGREVGARDWLDSPAFKLKIYNAILSKLLLDDEILQEFLTNKLSFRHYYVYKDKIVEPKEGRWIIELFEFLRSQLCT